MDVVGPDLSEQVGGVSVHVGDGLEAVLLARIEHPVNRALLVNLEMVGVEVLQEVLADDVAGRLALSSEGVGDEAKVCLKGLLAVCGFQELDGVGDDVVVAKVVLVGDGNDGVIVGHEGWVWDAGEVVVAGAPLVGEDESVLVERVASHHAAHGVGQKTPDLSLEVCLANGDVLVLDLDRNLSDHVVYLGEDAVELLLVCLETVEPLLALSLPGCELV